MPEQNPNPDQQSHDDLIEVEEFKVRGSQLADRIKDLIREGRARRVIVKKGDRVVFNIPLGGGVGATAAAIYLLPQIAAIGLAAALFSGFRIIVERDPETESGPN
ncbi:MAG: DUF4342 domain-containing protein [Bacteroidetes bacterium]|nr:DUF4342 domain-containing protein [Bacteroidota bacterium]